jgi:mycofactocin glycosyltransferase
VTTVPDITVVVISHNGASRLPDCLRSLERQSIRPRMEVVLVDDGSSDDTAEVGERFGARVVRHPVNRGVAAARNTGTRHARGALIIFFDDDMIATEDWAEQFEAAFTPDVLAVGGALELRARRGFLSGYVLRSNPFAPHELTLRHGDGLVRRLGAYLRRQWRDSDDRRREVSAIGGGNFACRRDDLLAVGLIDEALIAGEDYDLCWRLRKRSPGRKIIYEPRARASHVTSSSLRSLMRRGRWYGRGSCDLVLHRRVATPTIFFAPVLLGALLVASIRRPLLVVVAVLGPQLLYPKGLRTALHARTPSAVLDPYVQIGVEAAHNVGFAERFARSVIARAKRRHGGSLDEESDESLPR